MESHVHLRKLIRETINDNSNQIQDSCLKDPDIAHDYLAQIGGIYDRYLNKLKEIQINGALESL